MSYDDYIGRFERREDVVSAPLVERLAATLDCDPPAGGGVPLLGHWMLFQDWRRPTELGSDGHLARGSFLPAVQGLPRRLWGGGRLTFLGPLTVGEPVVRASTIASVEDKLGLSGRLVVVTVKHDIFGTHGHVISEEQDILYREA